jgi:hypothetical protein
VQDDKSTFKNKIPLEETLKVKINKNKVSLEETLKDKTNNNKTSTSTGIKGMQ